MSQPPLEDVKRDLGERDLWERSLARSQERRSGTHTRRSLASMALSDLDGPVRVQADDRDLSDPELWDYSASIANGKRIAAQPGFLPQARVAGVTLVVAACAAALPNPSGSATRAKASGGSTRVHVEVLKVGSRGPAVARVQRALGIRADGVFGPKTKRAVRAFQKRHGLLADGVVGPRTRKALFASKPKPKPAKKAANQRFVRAWWVVPVQRKLGVPADGAYGPVTRRAVRAFQKRKGLIVDGIVGPQTLRALGITRGGSPARRAAPAVSTRGARVATMSKRYLGIRYRWAGSSPSSGFDCSGFVMYLYRKVGVGLPHNAAMQYRYGRAVPRSSLRPGDLVFFNGLGHVGIYLRGNRFIHASSSGGNVKISSLSGTWYGARYVGARRL